MPNFLIKTLTLLCFLSFSINSFSQKTSTFTFGKTDSTKFRGFGIGFEYYSGHKEVSKIFKFKRNPIDEYKIGKGLYVTYFNLNQKKKIHYYIDGGFIFWNKQKFSTDSTFRQRSEILQLTGKYRFGNFAILGRFGGLLNHNFINDRTNTVNENNIDLTMGIGLSIPIPIKTKGLRFTVLVSRINKNYSLSGTIFLPLIFH